MKERGICKHSTPNGVCFQGARNALNLSNLSAERKSFETVFVLFSASFRWDVFGVKEGVREEERLGGAEDEFAKA